LNFSLFVSLFSDEPVRTVLLTLFLLLVATLPTRAQGYNFRNLSVADGLAQSQVYAMCQDRRGAIWFGTRGGGLARYDGVTFDNYSVEEGLANSFVNATLEDRHGNLWIATEQGLSRYDGVGFTNFNTVPPLSGTRVRAIAEDSSGVLWFGTQQGGLVRYDGQHFRDIFATKTAERFSILALLVDHSGKLWIGTDRGVRCYDGKRVQSWGVTDGLNTNTVSAIAEGKSGMIWLATYGGGLCGFDGKTFTQVRDGLSNTTLLSLLVDRTGVLWIGTSGGGVNRYEGGSIRVIGETEGLCNNVVTSIMQDSDGDIWFGSSGGGVSRLDGERFTHFTARQGKLGDWIYALREDRTGAIWFGSSGGGVTRYDGRIYKRYSEADGFTSGKVRAIYEDKRGVIWFGTVGSGLFSFDGGSFRHYGRSEGLQGRFINAIAEDLSGDLWLATSDAGVIRCRPPFSSAGGLSQISIKQGMPVERVYDLLVVPEGNVWCATDGGGICRIDPFGAKDSVRVKTFSAADGVTSNTVRSVVRDSSGRIAFGTAGGGILFYSGKRFSSLSKSDGISSSNIYALAVDHHGNLWIGSEQGIDRVAMDNEGKLLRRKGFAFPEGITGVETSQNAITVDRQGNVWIGTIRGAVKYNPRFDRPNAIPPKTHITAVRLFFADVSKTPYAGDSLLPWYHLPTELQLPYDQNSLSFDFVGISQRNPERVRYQWQLHGFDTGWSPQGVHTTAVYSNLPPGDYQLRVRSFNEDGVPDPTPALFTFRITPPYWGTWWFRLLAMIVGVGLAATVFALRVRAIQRRNTIERNELEMRRKILELRQQSLRLAMNPHFIFNALTSIQGFITGHNPQEARRYLTTFSRLMRSILQTSQEEHVSLEQEVSTIDHYLQLERLNAGGRFDYVIDLDPNINPATMAIPVMLTQPLVENAVYHGIRGSDRQGNILLAVRQSGAMLRITVEDNGIGRASAQLLRREASPDHLSSALGVISERLEIINAREGVASRLDITDLHDDEGNPSGTRVEVYIPWYSLE
jgi:ligand-binding sensor domain-containing protein